MATVSVPFLRSSHVEKDDGRITRNEICNLSCRQFLYSRITLKKEYERPDREKKCGNKLRCGVMSMRHAGVLWLVQTAGAATTSFTCLTWRRGVG